MPAKDFGEVLEDRHSRRSMSEPTVDQLAALLWHAARTRQSGTGRFGLRWEHRAAASGGGLHPTELVLVSRAADTAEVYDPVRHRLVQLATPGPEVRSLKAKASEVLPDAAGAILVLIGDIGVVSNAYENPESLLWRDAGCLIATLHLCAEWLGLAFCALGLLGNELASSVGPRERLQGVGVCMVGRRADSK